MTISILGNMPILHSVFLLGVRGLGAAGRRNSGGDSGEIVTELAAAVVAIAVVCLAVYAGKRVLHRRRYNSHASLFAGLCRLHGLDRGARQLLKQVVAAHRLVQPARVFTEPQWLDPKSLPKSLRGQTHKVGEIHQRLFLETGSGN